MPDDRPLHSVDTVHGALQVYPTKVVLVRSGCLAFLNHGMKGNKEIPIRSISAMQLKDAGMMTSGYLQFDISGSSTSTDGLLDATSDENTVMFKRGQQEDIEEAKSAIERLMNEQGGEGKPSNVSVADELEKYHNLLEKGAISQEDCDQKKDELLDG